MESVRPFRWHPQDDDDFDKRGPSSGSRRHTGEGEQGHGNQARNNGSIDGQHTHTTSSSDDHRQHTPTHAETGPSDDDAQHTDTAADVAIAASDAEALYGLDDATVAAAMQAAYGDEHDTKSDKIRHARPKTPVQAANGRCVFH